MSVSLALIPVALALRVIMGKKNFNNFINSNQIKIPSEFKDELDLVDTVRKAGYDIEKWGGTYKTHITKEKEFFFWENDGNRWVEVFTKYMANELISNFVPDLEMKSRRKIFLKDSFLEGDTNLSSCYPTNFRDEEILIKTLKEFGGTPVKYEDGSIKYSINNCQLLFIRADNAPYNVELTYNSNLKLAFDILTDIDDDYKHNVQAKTYEAVTAKVIQKGYSIESEEVLEDNSIMLTIKI